MTASVLVSVGTDHHPFTRLIEWVDSWADALAQPVDLVVQHGSSRPSRLGRNEALLGHDEILELFRNATVLVTQVGPGTILDANAVGRLPIVVARHPELGEHVDGHQIAFGRFMHEQGHAWCVDTADDLHAAMTRALQDPTWSHMPPRVSPAPQAAVEVGRIVDEVVGRRPGFVSWRGLRSMARRPRV